MSHRQPFYRSLDGLRPFYYLWHAFRNQLGCNPITFGYGITTYLIDLVHFFVHPQINLLKFEWTAVQPMLADKLSTHPLEPIYFYQDTWAAAHIFQLKPKRHVDVASRATTIGIISRFVPTTFVDLRPLDVALPNLTFMQGSVTALPFPDNSVKSLSSLCVIEHIGLGRYGDAIDPQGTEAAATDLQRVLARGGHLFISVPIDSVNRVYFNAHRAFTPAYVKSLFSSCWLVEERYLYGRKLYQRYDPRKGFGTGLFYFRKS